MQVVKLSESTAARGRVYFTCVDTTALQTRLQASDMSTFTVKISKNGAAAITPSSTTVTEVDSTNQKGVFYWEGNSTDFNTLGLLTVVITNAGGTKVMEKREIVLQVVAYDPYDAVRLGLTTLYNAAVGATSGAPSGIVRGATAAGGASGSITLDAGASATDSIYNGMKIRITGGTGAGQSNRIRAYVGSTQVATVAKNWITNPDNTSVFEILFDNTQMEDNSITSNAVASGAITSAKFAAGAIDATAIADGAVDAATFAAGAINAAAIASSALTTAKFASGAIDSTVLAASAIGASQLATGAITNAKFAAGAVDAAAIADGAIDAATFASGAITSSAIAASAIGASQIATGAITSTKFAAGAIDATAVADGAIDAATFAAGAINAAAIATDAIGSAQIAATAATEIGDAARDSVLAYSHDTGATVKGLLRRLEANVSGKADGLNGPTTKTYMRDGSTVAHQQDINPTAGTRDTSTITGSEA